MLLIIGLYITHVAAVSHDDTPPSARKHSSLGQCGECVCVCVWILSGEFLIMQVCEPFCVYECIQCFISVFGLNRVL